MVRSAVPHDLTAIAGMIRALAEYEKLTHECVFTDAELEKELFGPSPGAEVLVAEKAGRVVGFALFFQSFSTFLARRGIYLEDLFVLPEARGEGHAKALLQRLAALAVERGCGRLEWSVLDWNAQAIGFYRSIGAVPMDDWTVQRLTGDSLRALASATV